MAGHCRAARLSHLVCACVGTCAMVRRPAGCGAQIEMGQILAHPHTGGVRTPAGGNGGKWCECSERWRWGRRRRTQRTRDIERALRAKCGCVRARASVYYSNIHNAYYYKPPYPFGDQGGGSHACVHEWNVPSPPHGLRYVLHGCGSPGSLLWHG